MGAQVTRFGYPVEPPEDKNAKRKLATSDSSELSSDGDDPGKCEGEAELSSDGTGTQKGAKSSKNIEEEKEKFAYFPTYDHEKTIIKRTDAKTWVLVVNYEFEGVQGYGLREGNEHDLLNLRRLFLNLHGVTYAELSPHSSEISQLLSEEGLKKIFAEPEMKMGRKVKAPRLFLLFVLSHGEANGVILTDKNKAVPYDFFTTTTIMDSWQNNKFLKKCVKVNYFGPCRGPIESIGEYATKVLAFPKLYNIINFYATVESKKAQWTESGTWMVNAFYNTVRGLRKDVDLEELHVRMKRLIKDSSGSEETYQIAQDCFYPQKLTIFLHKRENPKKETNADAKKTACKVTAETMYDYNWLKRSREQKSGISLVFRSDALGVASSYRNERHHDMHLNYYLFSLDQLGFESTVLKLSDMENVLQNLSEHGLASNEGCLTVTIFAEKVLINSNNELAIQIGNEKVVEVGALMAKFTVPSFSEIPKIFLLLAKDLPARKEEFPQCKWSFPAEAIKSASPFSEFLFILDEYWYDDSALKSDLPARKIRWHSLWQMIKTRKFSFSSIFDFKDGRYMMWSTMTSKMGFKSRDKFISSRLIGRDTSLDFDVFVDNFIRGTDSVSLIIADPGIGKSRCSEELYIRLVVKKPEYFTIFVKITHNLVNQMYSEEEESETENLALENLNPKHIAFKKLKKVNISEERKKNLLEKLELERVFVILDGFDGVFPSKTKKVMDLIRLLREAKVKILVSSRPNQKSYFHSMVGDVAEYSLDKFNDQEKIILLHHVLGIEDPDECEALLNKFKSALSDFTSNPLQLKMICQLQNVHKLQIIDMYSIYKEFLDKKIIEDGLKNMLKLLPKMAEFEIVKKHCYSALTKCANALTLKQENSIADLCEEEIRALNISGVTAIDGDKIFEFVHLTYAEFLTANFLLHKYSVPKKSHLANDVELDLNCVRNVEPSSSVLKFIDSGLKNLGVKISQELTLILATKHTLEVCCKENLPHLFSAVFLVEQEITDPRVVGWLNESYNEANCEDENFGAYFNSCLSSKSISETLQRISPEFSEVKWLKTIFKLLDGRNKALETLKKAKNWQSFWPKSDFEDGHFGAYFISYLTGERISEKNDPSMISPESEVTGLDAVFKLLVDRNISDSLVKIVDKVKNWQLRCWPKTDFENTSFGAYFNACLSNYPMSEKLKRIAPELEEAQIRILNSILQMLIERNNTLDTLDKVLDKAKNWQSSWPKTEEDFSFAFDENVSKARGEQYPAALIHPVYNRALLICGEVDENIFLRAIEMHKTMFCPVTLQILLEKGFNLTHELGGKNLLTQMMVSVKDRSHSSFLLKYLMDYIHKIENHFVNLLQKNTHDPQTCDEKSQIFRKNIGAKSPTDLKLDLLSPAHKIKYLEHIYQRLGRSFDLDFCPPSKIVVEFSTSPFQDTMTSDLWDKCLLYLLHLTRSISELKSRILPMIRRLDENFDFQCSCSLVRIVFTNECLDSLQELAKRGYSFEQQDEDRNQMILHHSCYDNNFELSEFILKAMIGEKFFIDVNGVFEEKRSGELQLQITEKLSKKDGMGRTPLQYVYYGFTKENMVALMMRNLIGSDFVDEKSGVDVLQKRKFHEQLKIAKILVEKNRSGRTIVHKVVCYEVRDVVSLERLSLLKMTLRNILGKHFIDQNSAPKISGDKTRSRFVYKTLCDYENTVCSARMVVYFYRRADQALFELLLKNLMGKYFIDGNGETLVPERSDKEMCHIAYILQIKSLRFDQGRRELWGPWGLSVLPTYRLDPNCQIFIINLLGSFSSRKKLISVEDKMEEFYKIAFKMQLFRRCHVTVRRIVTVEHFEFLLKLILGKFFVNKDGESETARSKADEKMIHQLLMADNKNSSMTNLLLTYDRVDDFKLQLMNVFSLNFESGSDSDKWKSTISALFVAQGRNHGLTLLHTAVQKRVRRITEFMMKHQLGPHFVDYTNGERVEPGMEINLDTQKNLNALFLIPDAEGRTPLHHAIDHHGISEHYFEEELVSIPKMLLRNALGDYFVHDSGTTAKSLESRSAEEMKFVRDLLCSPDVHGDSCLSLSVIRSCKSRAFQALYKTIHSNLHTQTLPSDGSHSRETTVNEQKESCSVS